MTGGGGGLVRPEDILPLRSYRMGVLFPCEKTRFLPEMGKGLSAMWVEGCYSTSETLSVQTSQSRLSLLSSFVGTERKWNLTNKVERA